MGKLGGKTGAAVSIMRLIFIGGVSFTVILVAALAGTMWSQAGMEMKMSVPVQRQQGNLRPGLGATATVHEPVTGSSSGRASKDIAASASDDNITTTATAKRLVTRVTMKPSSPVLRGGGEAYVTFFTGRVQVSGRPTGGTYTAGVEQLVGNLQSVRQPGDERPLVILGRTEGYKQKLEQIAARAPGYVIVRNLAELDCDLTSPELAWGDVLEKLCIFKLTEYSRMLFIDADMMVNHPLNALFDLPILLDAEMVTLSHWTPETFCSCFFAFTPSLYVVKRLTEKIHGRHSRLMNSDGSDQGVLNAAVKESWFGDNYKITAAAAGGPWCHEGLPRFKDRAIVCDGRISGIWADDVYYYMIWSHIARDGLSNMYGYQVPGFVCNGALHTNMPKVVHFSSGPKPWESDTDNNPKLPSFGDKDCMLWWIAKWREKYCRNPKPLLQNICVAASTTNAFI
mmetsp:Transcript_34917/g.96415  ORF Transcript_34917/g.96415 Transcript_34917/m.96415 type:complete len:454 (-) Transcript_34917:51-1412(-)